LNLADIGAQRVRTLFLSDIHLGTRACRGEELLEFLKRFEFEQLYLVGDIVDFWAMSRTVHWPAVHNTVVQKILRLARRGVAITYVAGNHDEVLREFLDTSFGGISLADQCVHRGADGRAYLVLHGDRYDQVTHYARWLSVLGDVAYQRLIAINRMLSWFRRHLGIAGQWSLADYAKRNVLRAVSFIGQFERAVARDARRMGYEGVICGHIHTPAMKSIDGVTYMNCGDWVDSCSAVVEHLDGTMALVRLADLCGDAPSPAGSAGGEPYGEPRAAAELGVDLDRAPVQVHALLDDRQAEARA